jgi:PAS domain S-box-containing protein
MSMDNRELQAENEELRIRLEEAEEMLAAIRSGEVDALVVSSGEGDRIFTLEGADLPYRVLVETMSEGAATLNPDSTVLYCNSRLAHLLGTPLERILGKPLLHHVDQEDTSLFTALLERSLAEGCRLGESFRAELTIRTEAGNSVPVLLSCCSLDLAGSPGISVIVTDLSEQKRTDETIAAGELSSTILEQAGEAIIVCDETGRVIRASSQAKELFGLNPMFRSFDQLGPLQKAHSGLPFSIDGPLSGMVIKALEVEFQHQDRRLHLLLNARPLRRQQKILGCVVTMTDITGRKQAEEKLKKAQAAAEEANRAKSEFLANMSHEIRTPMTVFMAAIEHLLQIDRSPERRHLLGMADQSAKRLRNLIDDILDFSRIEARKLDLEEEAFDLRACIREAVEMFALPAREKGLRLATEVAPEIPKQVLGDPHKLGQVLVNLVGNAVKFTHAGEIRVTVQLRNHLLEFAVIDSGIGIPEEKHGLLFQSFSQIDSSFTRQFGGTGLGLAISKGLVDLMGGEISIQSPEGGGSAFIFTIPLKKAGQLSAVSVEALSEKPAFETSATRILLAEDEPMIREMIIMVLAQRGWQAETAESGRDALVKWEAGNFDIILMDLQMPEMNGLEATQTIRSRETAEGKRAAIIGLTAHARREIKEECLSAGMDQVLTKPVQIKDLISAIENFAG